MKNKFKVNKPLILHPFLFIISFNLARGEQITLLELLPYRLITLGITAFLFIIVFFILRNAIKAAILVSFVLVLFFWFGHFVIFLTQMELFPVRRSPTSLQPYWAAIFIIGVFLIFRTRSTLIKLQTGLNITASIKLVTCNKVFFDQ